MIAVLQHHLPGVFHRLILPVLPADVLPARDLREHQQPQAVAFVDEILALGIVGGAHRHAGKLLLQDSRVLPLKPLRSGVAHIRPALVPVQPPQEGLLPVQVEAVGLKFGGAEAHLDFPGIHHPADFQQGHPAGIENGALRVPALDAGAADGDHAPGGECLLQQHPLALLQLHQKDAPFGVLQSGLDFQGGKIRGRYVQVFNIAPFPDVQPDLPVKPAVGQIVDDKSEGRHRAVLRGVQLHRQPVFSAQNRRVGDVHPERGVSAPVGRQFFAVQEHRGNMRRAVKLHEQALPRQRRLQRQLFPVAADHLIGLAVGVVLRDFLHGMGQADALPFPFSDGKSVIPVGNELPSVT